MPKFSLLLSVIQSFLRMLLRYIPEVEHDCRGENLVFGHDQAPCFVVDEEVFDAVALDMQG